jgi:hypothetical protein
LLGGKDAIVGKRTERFADHGGVPVLRILKHARVRSRFGDHRDRRGGTVLS